MIQASAMIVYFNGQYLPKSQVAISPDDRGFLFADGIYEVIRSYRGKLFKCAEHLERLAHGLKELRIEGVHTPNFEQIAQQLLQANQLQAGDALVYIQVTRGAAPRSHEFPPADTTPTVYVQARVHAPPVKEQDQGAAVILAPDQRWSRCDIKTINLLPNILAHQRAREAGAFEAVFYADGLLSEGSHSSILFMENDVLICPPLSSRLLPSVTRKVVVELALAENIEVEVHPCREGDLLRFDEIMMLSTGVEIVPITEVNGHKVGHGHAGRITRGLQSAFRAIVGP